MRTRLALSMVAVLGLVGMTSCGSNTTSTSSGGGSTAPTTAAADTLSGTAWTLASYQGPAGKAVPAAPKANATLAFDANGGLGGSTGCNQFRGTYTLDAQALAIQLGPMTQMACPGAVLTAQETAVVQLLPQVNGFSATADTLTLTGAGGAELLTYAAGLTGLEGTSWTATGVNNGTGGVETTALIESLTATFAADGAFSGFGGCNTVSGTYQTSGGSGLTITGLTSTKKACAADVDTLESQYIAALGRVTSYAISGNALTLRADDGAIQASYTLAD